MGEMIAAPDLDPFAFLNCSENYRTATCKNAVPLKKQLAMQ